MTETFVEEREDDGKYSDNKLDFGNFANRIQKTENEDKVEDFKGTKNKADDDNSITSESSSASSGEVGSIFRKHCIN